MVILSLAFVYALRGLAPDERLGRLALRVQRIELLLQTFLGRLARVDRLPDHFLRR
jgi:hypothetical protein